jgi:hypothetical protein
VISEKIGSEIKSCKPIGIERGEWGEVSENKDSTI